MIFKTVRVYRRKVRTWGGCRRRRLDEHIELIRRETWWLFGVIPLYSRDEIVGTNL